MTTFNLSGIMDGIATTLINGSVIDAGHCWAWPVKAFNPPCVVVGYPRPGGLSFDMTFKRGADEVTFPAWFVCGLVVDKASRDVLSGIIDGANSIKLVLETQPANLGGVVSSVHVTDCDVEVITDGAQVEYLSARFDVQVIT